MDETRDPLMALGPLQVRMSDFHAFLDAADVWSRRLLETLNAWSQALHQPLSPSASSRAASLADSAGSLGLSALAELARALSACLAHAQAHALGLPQHAPAFLLAAREIRRLVDQCAAGVVDLPAPYLLQALEDIDASAATEDPARSLREAFVAGLPTRLAALGDAWIAYRANAGSPREARRCRLELESFIDTARGQGIAALTPGLALLGERLAAFAAGADAASHAGVDEAIAALQDLAEALHQDLYRLQSDALVVADARTALVVGQVMAQEGYRVHKVDPAETRGPVDDLAQSRAVVAVIDLAPAKALAWVTQARADARCERVPVLLMTTESHEGFLSMAYKAGADDLIVKPFDPADVGQRVQAARRRRASATSGAPPAA